MKKKYFLMLCRLWKSWTLVVKIKVVWIASAWLCPKKSESIIIILNLTNICGHKLFYIKLLLKDFYEGLKNSNSCAKKKLTKEMANHQFWTFAILLNSFWFGGSMLWVKRGQGEGFWVLYYRDLTRKCSINWGLSHVNCIVEIWRGFTTQ